jgi:hypothetical protein
MNFWSSSCSVADNLIVLLISVNGALGLSSILWSHGHFSGIFLDSSSLNMSVKVQYGQGILLLIIPLLMDALFLVLVVKIA